MPPFDFIVLALATWYLAYSIAHKDGPWQLFKRVRERLPLGGLTACIVCLSFWIGGAFYVLSIVAQPVVSVFAVAGLAILLHRFTGGDLV